MHCNTSSYEGRYPLGVRCYWNLFDMELRDIQSLYAHLEQKVLSGSFKGSLEWYCGGTPKGFFQAPFTRVLWKEPLRVLWKRVLWKVISSIYQRTLLGFFKEPLWYTRVPWRTLWGSLKNHWWCHKKNWGVLWKTILGKEGFYWECFKNLLWWIT